MTELTHRRRVIGLILWCSFLVAAAMTMLCFAYVDPDLALTGEGAPAWWTRRTVYAAGFFCFWIASAGASALTLFMAQSPTTQSGH